MLREVLQDEEKWNQRTGERWCCWGKSWVQFWICWPWSACRKGESWKYNLVQYKWSKKKNPGIDENCPGRRYRLKRKEGQIPNPGLCQHFKLKKWSSQKQSWRNKQKDREPEGAVSKSKEEKLFINFKINGQKCQVLNKQRQADFRKRKTYRTKLRWGHLTSLFFCLFFLQCLGPLLRHTEVPRLGVKSEL